jgi:hypothetical protein
MRKRFQTAGFRTESSLVSAATSLS